MTGFVIDAMLKIASAGIGTFAAVSSLPAVPEYSSPSRSTTRPTTPGVSPRATAAFICAVIADFATSDNLGAADVSRPHAISPPPQTPAKISASTT